MDKIKHCINHNRFIPIDTEELSALELIGKGTEKTNELVDKTNEHEERITNNENKKVSFDDMKEKFKFDNNFSDIDYRGKWFGLDEPTLSDEGMRSQVQKNRDDIIKANEQLESIVSEYESTIIVEDYRKKNKIVDDDALIQAIFSLGGSKKVKFQNKIYKIKNGIEVDGSNTIIEGNNTIFDCSELTGVAITVKNKFNKFIPNNVISGVTLTTNINNPNNYKVGTIAIKIDGELSEDIYANNINVLKTFNNIYINGFETGVYLGKRTWGIKFENSQIRCNKVGIWVDHPVTNSDSGENNNFEHCVIAYNLLGVKITNWITDCFFNSCSFDHNFQDLDQINGSTFFTQCHFEHKIGQTNGKTRWRLESKVDQATGQNNGSWKSEPTIAKFNQCWFITAIPNDNEKQPCQYDSYFEGNDYTFITLENSYFSHLTCFQSNYLYKGNGIFNTDKNVFTKFRTEINSNYAESHKLLSQQHNLCSIDNIKANIGVPFKGYYTKDKLNNRWSLGEDGKKLDLSFTNNSFTMEKEGWTIHEFCLLVPIDKKECNYVVKFNSFTNANIGNVNVKLAYVGEIERELINGVIYPILPYSSDLSEDANCGGFTWNFSGGKLERKLTTIKRSRKKDKYLAIYFSLTKDNADGVGNYIIESLEVNSLI